RRPEKRCKQHWRRIRTNNPLERILREIRRRTRVVGAFPDAQPRRREAAPHRRHGVVYEEISQHRAAQGPADERCHHRVSQGRAPLSQTESAKDSGHYRIFEFSAVHMSANGTSGHGAVSPTLSAFEAKRTTRIRRDGRCVLRWTAPPLITEIIFGHTPARTAISKNCRSAPT